MPRMGMHDGDGTTQRSSGGGDGKNRGNEKEENGDFVGLKRDQEG